MNIFSASGRIEGEGTRVGDLHHVFLWLVWEAAVPLVLLSLFWPFYAVMTQEPVAFGKAFEDYHIVLLAALLSLGVSVKARLRGGGMLCEIALAIGVVQVAVFAGVRVAVILAHGSLDKRLTIALACFGCTAVLLSIIFGLYVLVHSERTALTAISRSLSQ